jgi:hypothetical protein
MKDAEGCPIPAILNEHRAHWPILFAATDLRRIAHTPRATQGGTSSDELQRRRQLCFGQWTARTGGCSSGLGRTATCLYSSAIGWCSRSAECKGEKESNRVRATTDEGHVDHRTSEVLIGNLLPDL